MPVKYSIVKDRTATAKSLVGLGRIELPTSPLSGVRSSQLSYRPGWASEQNRAHKQADFPKSWWSWSGSNRRPPECKSGALPAELQPLVRINQSRPIGRAGPGSSPKPISTIRSSRPLHYCCGSETLRAEKSERVYGVERLSPCTCRRLHPRSLRKEVIQPQVLLRLPCYDFTPIMNHTLGRCPPCGLARRLLVQSTFVM